ncbi:glucosaminidase domain-containing protein [Catenovulum sp. SM1970]|uniref:glucosaminidase domain-containing protein n=1 Tax=Marinifaba aquimaris TaxID=2741323 RepID=UPI001572E233|nr:glucosaminidase domain-containing protein [Marinifaba aquimaris]NTS78309.1 glucosaminidase domain-containing protein [Marinifaba aquimaris]
MLVFKKFISCISGIAILSACAPTVEEREIIAKRSDKTIVAGSQPVVEERIASIAELQKVFEKFDYDAEQWQQGSRGVPRIVFPGVGESWAERSQKMPVSIKKDVFFRLMAPLILISNEHILLERERVQNDDLTSPELKALAVKYRIIKDSASPLTEEMRQALLLRVDILPVSLALAQAAEESGWGTSRFAREGNAFFGQWDFSGKGMIPKQQRKELGNYGLARFDSPLDSVKGYMLNINTTGAYEKLRSLRAQLRADGQAISGMELATTLDKYSERGQAYIDGIQGMISYNKLETFDQAYLIENDLVEIISKNQN